METKLTFAKGWCNFWAYMSGILADQGNQASSKRVVLLNLLMLFNFQIIVYFGRPADQVNMMMFWGNLGAIITFGGYVTSEFFKSLSDNGLIKPQSPA